MAGGGRRVGLIAVVGAAVVLATGCAGVALEGPVPSPAASPPVHDRATTLVEGLAAPWSIAFHDDVALVSERDTARVVEVGDSGEVREVAVIDGVAHGGEGGLLGLAVRDDFLYAYSTGEDENRVQRFALSGGAGDLRLGAPDTILSAIPASGNHNGGRIAFGPDGMLYVATGDAGDHPAAQDRDSLSGKILRVTPEGAVPDDNPFPGSPVYSFGHRNPQGLAWAADGTLFASEFGQDTWDELNVITAGGNYGWPEAEGIAEREGFIDPVQQWTPAAASPSGITVIDGAVFIANLRGERVRAVPLDDTGASSELLVGELGRVRDAVRAPDGSLWLLTNNTDGRGSPRDDDDRIVRLTLD